jgi:hypothetical protein
VYARTGSPATIQINARESGGERKIRLDIRSAELVALIALIQSKKAIPISKSPT